MYADVAMTSDELIARRGEGSLIDANDPDTRGGFGLRGSVRHGKQESIGV